MSEIETKAEVETEQKSESTEQIAETIEQKPFFEFKGRKFNTEAELNAFMDALTFAQGKAAQQYGDLKKEVEPLLKYNLKNADVDDVSIMKKVAEHRGNGENDAADALMFEYVKQVKASSDSKTEKNRLWNDYVKSRKEIFEVLDEDMAKDHFFRNYEDKLPEMKDPFSTMDTIFQPKFSKLKPTKSEDSSSELSATLGSGNKSVQTKGSTTEKKVPEKSAILSMYDELGVKY